MDIHLVCAAKSCETVQRSGSLKVWIPERRLSITNYLSLQKGFDFRLCRNDLIESFASDTDACERLLRPALGFQSYAILPRNFCECV